MTREMTLEEVKALAQILKIKKQPKLYSYKAVDELIDRLIDKGYNCICVEEGTSGSGHWICLSNDDYLYNVEITEVYINCWSSAHKVRRFKNLSKRQEELLEGIF